MNSHTYFAASYLQHPAEEALALTNLFNDPKWIELSHQKTYLVKEWGDASYRQINHWSSIGLIDDPRKSRKWRKFSFIDLTWIKILQTLRSFGFSNEKLALTKECLFDLKGFLTPGASEALDRIAKVSALPASKEKDEMMKAVENFFNILFPEKAGPDTPLPFFDLYVIMSALGHSPVLLVYEDGFCDIGLEPLILKPANKELPPHIRLNLRDFVPGKLEKLVEAVKSVLSIDLKTPEAELINAIRSGDLEEVRARIKNGEIRLVEQISRVDPTKKVVELLKEGSYQNLLIQQKQGGVTKITRSLKRQY